MKLSLRFSATLMASAASLIGIPAHAAPVTVTHEQFDSGVFPSNWKIGAQSTGAVAISTDTSQNHSGSLGSLKGSYPVSSGGSYVWAAYNVAFQNTYDIYIEFWAKMPVAKQGLKFLKIFGGNAGGVTSNYANTTFALDYTGVDIGGMYQVSFGDGTTVSNDTAKVINFDGTYPNWVGRSYGTAIISTPMKSKWGASNWGTNWHRFRIHAKFNSGTTPQTEVADGEYFVEIDGVVYVDAKKLLNRHYTNAPIDRIELFGWAQNGTVPFELWYDSVRISTGGFLTTMVPNPPSVTVQ